MAKMVKCKTCGKQIAKSAKFCPYCGAKRKKHRLLIAVLVILALILIISVMGEDESGGDFGDSSKVQGEEQEEVTIDKGTIFEGNKTKIEVTGVSNESSSYDVSFYFLNESEKNLSFDIHAYAVNGIMSDDSVYTMDTDVAAGKQANNVLSISKSWMNNMGIANIEYIDLLFWAYDSDKSFKDFETDVIRVETSLYAGDNTYSNGEQQYSNDGISVSGSSLLDNNLSFYVENTNDYYTIVSIENFSANDFTYDTGIQAFEDYVLPGCIRLFNVEIDSDFLEKNNISEAEKAEFGLNVRPMDEREKEYNTDVIYVDKE